MAHQLSSEYINDRFNKIEQQNSQIIELSKHILDNTEILKLKADAILRQTFQLAEFTAPRLFIILPDDTPKYNPAHWFHLNYQLYFLCECENGSGPHLAFHEGYKIKQPREFLRQYGPYLRKMLTIVMYAVSVGSLVIPHLSHITSGTWSYFISHEKIFANNLTTQIKRLDEILTEAEKSYNVSTHERNDQYAEGADLRGIESFLKKTDDHRRYGNLFRSTTKSGHVRWVCIQHYDSRYGESQIKSLYEEFQKLGGAIRGDVAIIDGDILSKPSGLIDVLCQGLPIFSLILKNLTLNGEHFDKLLHHVSQRSAIHNLEIENVIISKWTGNTKKRHIIFELNNILEKNDKLTIQYSFTKPLDNFNDTLTNTITKSNPRLVFRLRSREDIHLLELVGTNKTGFTFSINNYIEENDKIYHDAINNILSRISNITKIHLNNGVISKNSWSIFRQYLIMSKSIQQLIIRTPLTLQQTRILSEIFTGSKTLKTLSIFKIEDEEKGCENIFNMLSINDTLSEFSLMCHTYQLKLDFIARYLLQNKSLEILRLSKCIIDKNTDIELVENFLKTTSIHTLTLELLSTNYEERFARAIDKNHNLQILELKGLNCSAIFHRKDPENNIELSAPIKSIKRPSQKKTKKFLGLFSCHRGEDRRDSYEEIIPISVLKDHRKHVSSEPFYALCDHPSLYKQIQEISKNFKLEELEVTIGDDVKMETIVLSMKLNSTVTRLRFCRETFTNKDIQLLVEGLRNNTTITDLILNEVEISMNDIRQFFDDLRDHRTLRMLEIKGCVSNSDRHLLIREIKLLEEKNPFLKVVYENSESDK
jgi:hypothetical protein